MDANIIAACLSAIRPELLGYLTRMVVKPQLAEEIAQTAFLRAHSAMDSAPEDETALRAWLFRIATHLAIDELRRHAHWRETVMLDLREAAEADPAFVQRSQEMIDTPETSAIAREHLAVCFTCTLRNLPEQKASALLLKEVYGFSIAEIAGWLDATPAQAKNWLQEARNSMDERYRESCALIAKQGICHQCVELDGFFRAGQGSPLPQERANLDDRIAVLRDLRAQPIGKWHRMLLDLLE